MSAVTSTSSSAGVAYAMQLAQTSATKRSLYNLGNAIQSGDLVSANSILTAFINANPQYASSSGTSTTAQPQINQDFQALASAISSGQVDAAQSAWAQVSSDLTNSGVAGLSDPASSTAQLLAQTDASIEQQIVSDAFGTSSNDGLSVASLLGGSGDSTNLADLTSSLIGSGPTYQPSGNTSPSTAAGSVGNNLDAVA